MGERETMKLGVIIGEYLQKKDAILRRLEVLKEEHEALPKLSICDSKAFYASILDIEGDAISLLDEIREYKRLYNMEV